MKIIKTDNTIEFHDVILESTGYKLRCHKVIYHLDNQLVECYDNVFKDKMPRIAFYLSYESHPS